MATIIDVAKFAGVSTATVSRVVNTPDRVNEDTRTAVESAIASLNFRPNRAAQVLKRQSSRTVGVVVNRFGSPYFGNLMDGIEQSLRKVHYKTIAEAGHESSEGQIEAWMSLIDRQCESFIVHADAVSDDALTTLMTKHPTTVLINRNLPDFAERCVYLKNEHAGRLAAQHLLDNGHRDLAIITGPLTGNETRDRQNGFLGALKDAGITVPDTQIAFGRHTEDGAQDAMTQLLDAGGSFTAVFVHNDVMAAGVIEACRARNVRVPEDMSVMGFDDLDLARHLNPKLTTVRQPVTDIGATAAQLAHSLAASSTTTPPLNRVFEAEVIVRASVKDISQ